MTPIQMKTSISKFILASVLISCNTMMTAAFVAPKKGSLSCRGVGMGENRRPTALNLEDRIAKMIDDESYRLGHKNEEEEQRLRKQREWMEPKLPENFDFEELDLNSGSALVDGDGVMNSVPGFSGGVNRSVSNPRKRKDKIMADNDPMRYCADRCVATGNCDVFEDMFEMDPAEVIKFCKECVLSEDEEPCDIPETIFRDDDMGMHP